MRGCPSIHLACLLSAWAGLYLHQPYSRCMQKRLPTETSAKINGKTTKHEKNQRVWEPLTRTRSARACNNDETAVSQKLLWQTRAWTSGLPSAGTWRVSRLSIAEKTKSLYFFFGNAWAPLLFLAVGQFEVGLVKGFGLKPRPARQY